MCRIKLLLLLSVIVSFPTSSRVDVPPPLFSKGEVVFNGKQLGTPGSLRNDGNVIANLLDANSWTRWDSPDNTGTDWAGVDAGIARNPTRVRISELDSIFIRRRISGIGNLRQ